MALKDRVGKWGEDFAAAYLQSFGVEILQRNLKTQACEIDILCNDSGTLVVAEVKTRKSTRSGVAAEAIDKRRCARLSQAAVEVLKCYPDFVQVRVDGIFIDVVGNIVRVEHIRSIT